MSVDPKMKKEWPESTFAPDESSVTDAEMAVKESVELVKMQKDAIAELKGTHSSLTGKKEVSELKISTLNLLASKNAKELSVLKREIHLYEVSVEEQVQQMRQMQVQIRESGKDIEAKKNEFEGLKKEIFLKKRRTVEDRKELKDLTNEITEYNEKLVRIKDEIENESIHLAHVEKELESLKAEHTGKVGELENLFIELLTRKKRHESLKAQKEQLARTVSKNKQEIETSVNDIAHWKKHTEQVEQEIATLQASFERKNMEYSELRDHLSKGLIDLDHKRTIFDEETVRDQNLTFNLAAVKEKMDRVHHEFSQKQGQIFELRRSTEQKKTRLVIMEEQTANFAQSIIQLEKEINQNEAIQASLDISLRSLSKTLEGLDSNRTALAQNVSDKEKHISNTRTDISALEKDIYKLRQDISNASEKVMAQEKTLNALQTQKNSFAASKEEKSAELREKETVTREQSDHIQELELLLKESNHEYSILVEKSKEYNRKLEENKSFINALNMSVGTSENYLGEVRTRVRSALDGIAETEENIFSALQDLEVKKITLESLNKDVNEKLRAAASHKEVREKELSLYLENLDRKQSELQRHLGKAEALKHEIEKAKVDLTNTKTQILVVDERIVNSDKRNKELMVALEEQALVLNSLTAEKEQMSRELHFKTQTETALLSKIEEKTKSSQELQFEMQHLSQNDSDLKQKIEQQNQKLDQLQQDEQNTRLVMVNKRGMLVSLQENLEELHFTNDDYQKKIEVQNKNIEENSVLIDSLSKKNKYLIEQLAKYEEIYNKNIKHADSQGESIKALTNLAREREAVLNGYAKKFENNVEALSPATLAEIANIERAIDVTALDQMLALKRSLESRFFNLTVKIDENVTFMDELVESESVNVATAMHTAILHAIEDCFTNGAEILLDVRCDQKGIMTTMNVSSIKDVASHQAKNVMVPVAKQMMSKFSDHGASVNYRIKLNSSGNIDKLTIDCKLVYPSNPLKRDIEAA